MTDYLEGQKWLQRRFRNVQLPLMARKIRPRSRDQNARPLPTSRSSISIILLITCMAGVLSFVFYKPTKKTALVSNPHSPSNTVQTEVEPVKLASTNISISSPNPATDIDKSTEHQNKGALLLHENRIDDAIKEFRLGVQFNLEDEDAYFNLALALARNGNREEAKKQYLEALRIYPEYAEAHNNLGNLLVQDGRFDEAVKHFEEALKASPDNAAANNNLGNALARAGRLPEAISSFTEALRIKPEYVQAHYNLAYAYLNQKRFPEAIAEFSEALRHQPDFEPARRGIERVQQLQNLNKGIP